jgi:small redox-active disulfide protein 2
MIIEILGMGCNNCERLKNNVKKAVDEMGVEARIIKVEDFEILIRKGITMTPGLVIDGEIRSMGRVPSVDEIEGMLQNSRREKGAQPAFDVVMINPTCGCSANGTVYYLSSGGSNVGQITNETVKSLVGRGRGEFSCQAGVGSHGEGFVTSAKKAERVVALDGCAAQCAYKTLKHAGIEPSIHVAITDMGVKKSYDLDPLKGGCRQSSSGNADDVVSKCLLLVNSPCETMHHLTTDGRMKDLCY